MKAFISWSGERSLRVALALNTFLRQLIQAVDPWMSTEIDRGARWASELARGLDEPLVGIICLTRESLDAPWVLFEAGALSKASKAIDADKTYVCTILIGLEHNDVAGPLAQFQHTSATREGIFNLMRTINRAVGESGEKAVEATALESLFGKLWPDLDAVLTKVQKGGADEHPVRNDGEKLDEVLSRVRRIEESMASTRPVPFTATLEALYQDPIWVELVEFELVMQLRARRASLVRLNIDTDRIDIHTRAKVNVTIRDDDRDETHAAEFSVKVDDPQRTGRLILGTLVKRFEFLSEPGRKERSPKTGE